MCHLQLPALLTLRPGARSFYHPHGQSSCLRWGRSLAGAPWSASLRSSTAGTTPRMSWLRDSRGMAMHPKRSRARSGGRSSAGWSITPALRIPLFAPSSRRDGGRVRIERELSRRGIEASDVPGWPELYLSEESEEEDCLRARWPRRRITGEKNDYEKIVRFLSSRGYPLGLATRIRLVACSMSPRRKTNPRSLGQRPCGGLDPVLVWPWAATPLTTPVYSVKRGLFGRRRYPNSLTGIKCEHMIERPESVSVRWFTSCALYLFHRVSIMERHVFGICGRIPRWRVP